MASSPAKQQRPMSDSESPTVDFGEIHTNRSRSNSRCDQQNDLAGNDSPGPAAYGTYQRSTMRATYPTSPSYSFTTRHRSPVYSRSPGPGAYHVPDQNVYKKRSPVCSFYFRHSLQASTALIIEYKD